MNYINNLLGLYIGRQSNESKRLNEIVDKLQPPGAEQKKSYVRWLLIGIIPVVVLLWIGLPYAPLLFDLAITPVRSMSAWYRLGIYGAMGIAGLVLYLLIVYAISKPVISRNKSDNQFMALSKQEKMLTYVFGSGAEGLCKALNKMCSGIASPQLAIFAQPPTAPNRGQLSFLSGPTIATAPVKYAEGDINAANMSRDEEGQGFLHEGHKRFVQSLGPDKIKVEMSFLHAGKGKTSITCQSQWQEERTSRAFGADPTRFAVLVKDKTDSQPKSLWGNKATNGGS